MQSRETIDESCHQNILLSLYNMYRTIDTSWNTLETWDTREQVSPTLDYHKIQHVKLKWIDQRPVVYWQYDSLYDFHNHPF